MKYNIQSHFNHWTYPFGSHEVQFRKAVHPEWDLKDEEEFEGESKRVARKGMYQWKYSIISIQFLMCKVFVAKVLKAVIFL